MHWWKGVHDEIEWAQAGANLIMHSTDITLVAQHLQSELNALRAALGESGVATSKLDSV